MRPPRRPPAPGKRARAGRANARAQSSSAMRGGEISGNLRSPGGDSAGPGAEAGAGGAHGVDADGFGDEGALPYFAVAGKFRDVEERGEPTARNKS